MIGPIVKWLLQRPVKWIRVPKYTFPDLPALTYEHHMFTPIFVDRICPLM